MPRQSSRRPARTPSLNHMPFAAGFGAGGGDPVPFGGVLGPGGVPIAPEIDVLKNQHMKLLKN
jgi:hypothetical protein